MRLLYVIFKRQLASYLGAPATYLCIAVFLAASTTITFQTSRLPGQDSTDLLDFFQLHPWFYLLLTPLLSTQLWSDEYKAGSIAFLKTLPISNFDLVAGKFLAAWFTCGIALSLSFPLVITAHYLGNPDNAVIASQFIASWLLAGSYLSVGCFICTLAHHRFTIFILTLMLLLAAIALPSILDVLDHQASTRVLGQLIPLNPALRFDAINNGTFSLPDSLYFPSMIFTFLAATVITLNIRNG